METLVKCQEGLENIILRMNKNHYKLMRKWHDMLYFEKHTRHYPINPSTVKAVQSCKRLLTSLIRTRDELKEDLTIAKRTCVVLMDICLELEENFANSEGHQIF